MSNEDIIKKSFCVLPWIQSFVNNDGSYHVCCTGEEFNNKIKDENGDAFNVRDKHKVQEIVNSEYLKKVRLDLLSGKLPAICTRCIQAENRGSSSRRNVENSAYENVINSLINNTKADGSIEPNFLLADYRLGNTCNLQCRMCYPQASSKWKNDYKEMFEGITDKKIIDEFYDTKSLNNSDIESVLFDFSQKAHSLTRLHFGGGEPLIHKNMIAILAYCIEKGFASNITLSYNTNLTVLPDEILEQWKHFKAISLLVSIDGIGVINDYIRYPSKWADVDNNLKFIDKHYKLFNISEVLISTTVQMHNICHLPKFYNYLKQFEFICQLPHLVMLNSPRVLNIVFLPEELKKQVFKKLSAIAQFFKLSLSDDSKGYLVESLHQCLSVLKQSISEDLYKKGQRDFILYTQRFDDKKGLSYKESHPEFIELFESIKID